jgi:hypothetical protein
MKMAGRCCNESGARSTRGPRSLLITGVRMFRRARRLMRPNHRLELARFTGRAKADFRFKPGIRTDPPIVTAVQ